MCSRKKEQPKEMTSPLLKRVLKIISAIIPESKYLYLPKKEQRSVAFMFCSTSIHYAILRKWLPPFETIPKNHISNSQPYVMLCMQQKKSLNEIICKQQKRTPGCSIYFMQHKQSLCNLCHCLSSNRRSHALYVTWYNS